jgi:3-oxoadipate enol-lactonase
MPRAELRDAELYYETAGDGPPLLLIGGTWGDLRQTPGPFDWPGAERFRVAAFDHRGQGRSTAGGRAQPTMADFAADALALADHLGWERFGVLAVSFGGMVAQELALATPQRVQRLVLVCTSMGGDSSSYPLHELYETPAGERAARLARLLDTRARTDAALARAIEDVLTSDANFAMHSDPPDGLVRQLRARRGHDTTARIGGLATPTLVIAGRFDGISPLPVSETLASSLANAQLAVLEGGHGRPLLLQDARGWPLVTSFLAGAGAAGEPAE